VTLTFNLAPNVALGDAVTALEKVQAEMACPAPFTPPSRIGSGLSGFAEERKWLISRAGRGIHRARHSLREPDPPLTILSTLPPAGVGAILALLLTRTDLSIIALIGIILLIGIVKKNAIMMIDFALQAERDQGLPPSMPFIRHVLLRFRPIMMTTMAALFGGLRWPSAWE